MTAWQVLGEAAAREFSTFIRDLRWNWRSDELGSVLGQLGWQVTHEIPDGPLTAATGWGLGDDRALVSREGVTVSSLDASLTSSTHRADLDGAGPGSAEFLVDAFAGLYQATADVFGPPDNRRPGPTPSAVWVRGETTLTLVRASLGVAVRWQSTADAEAAAAYEARARQWAQREEEEDE